MAEGSTRACKPSVLCMPICIVWSMSSYIDMKTKEYRISWTWNNITLWLWIRIIVKTLRTVGLNH